MKKEEDKNYLIKILNIKLTTYGLIMTILFIALAIWGMNSYIYQKKMMKNQSHIKAKVTHLRNSTGNNLSLSPYIIYQFTIDGQVIERGQKSQYGLSPRVGDCIEIIYSTKDVNVSEIDFARGIVQCD